jgi:hypothetical protein
MIEEVLEMQEYIDMEMRAVVLESVKTLKHVQQKVLWYWLLGFTQEETRHMIFPGRSRAHIWQVKSTTLKLLKESLSGAL